MDPLTQQEKQVVEGFQQLTPERRRVVMQAMFGTDADAWKRYQTQGEDRLRELAAQRGLDWDQLDNERRQDFVSELLREEQR